MNYRNLTPVFKKINPDPFSNQSSNQVPLKALENKDNLKFNDKGEMLSYADSNMIDKLI